MDAAPYEIPDKPFLGNNSFLGASGSLTKHVGARIQSYSTSSKTGKRAAFLIS